MSLGVLKTFLLATGKKKNPTQLILVRIKAPILHKAGVCG